MPVLVDSNVILDIASDDPKWGAWSDAQVTKHHRRGLVINPIIFAELCAGAENMTEVEGVVSDLKLEYRELPREVLFLAAKAFLQYRRRGGTKTSPLPDFFIGAHAAALGISILTRDKGRYTTYFPQVRLICA
jgi:predicted nucleic acid-binding protein